ncbi:ankyrin repeat-containing protein At5g02620-like [Rhododendron vialii]|uniref:ankyrin repeat-containing protein At5g02620-like n=1 Tax=Rhododendron vialii TaxID=182163 RepID=UPI0026600D44|nr:ankyrin repeat-containing protein At5g02620-like [Rhododendron vialii]
MAGETGMDQMSNETTVKGEQGHNSVLIPISSKFNSHLTNTVHRVPAELGSSSSSCANVNLKEISMDANLYAVVMEGKDGHHSELKKYTDKFESHVTPTKNTVLHVAAAFGRSCCAKVILEASPLLFCRKNTDGETPLHFALAEGKLENLEVAKLLIQHAKSEVVTKADGGEPGAALTAMLSARNHNGDTVRHLAARFANEEILVEILHTEYPEIDYAQNKAGETLLYLVVVRRFKEFKDKEDKVVRFKDREVRFNAKVVSQIIETSKSLAYDGPSGSTAMHMAAINDDVAVMDILHKWKNHLIKKPDAYGWTPLHFAARCGRINAIDRLLSLDKSLAYVTASNDYEGNTALHIATALGDTKVMKRILHWCPDCWEVVNSKKQNILHIAADLERDEAMSIILKMPWATRVIHGKDNDGNTPPHVLASKGQLDRFEKQRPSSVKYGWNYTSVFNNKDLTPREVRDQNESRTVETKHEEKGKTWQREISYYNRRDIPSKDREAVNNWKEAKVRKEEGRKDVDEQRRKKAKTHMIVATLIATISFTASFTIPGGYDPNPDSNPDSKQGMAILLREFAFKVFVLTNTATVIFSASSVFLFVSASIFTNKTEEDKQITRYRIALALTIMAMVAMMVAFISGTFAMLKHSLGFAIGTCVMSCFAYIVYASEFYTFVTEKIKRALENDRQPYLSNEEYSIEEGQPLEKKKRRIGDSISVIFARQRQKRKNGTH